MEKNVGPEDRVVRVVAGIGLLVLLYFVEMSDIAQILVGVAAALLIISGLLARSLIYRMLDIDTSVQEQSYSTTDDRSGL
ncbi:MAG TPA: DUF2892 domain-containing protein [Sphingomicrobium sp.]|nr:DUF2892 domain-containing protein [Sphingomicrobium sp.]